MVDERRVLVLHVDLVGLVDAPLEVLEHAIRQQFEVANLLTIQPVTLDQVALVYYARLYRLLAEGPVCWSQHVVVRLCQAPGHLGNNYGGLF